ncbi:hypothetical protein IT401_01280 [Candidatus Nomurabacteria bacterium]|nr:hypothetical protein [Candidatus Nomurabacteria bacterium]
MKKIIIAIIGLLGTTTTFPQQQNNCSIEELILLSERPKILKERDAYNLIKGDKKEISVNCGFAGYTHPEAFKVFSCNKEVTVSLTAVPGEQAPVWKEKTRYIKTGTVSMTQFWVFLAFGISIGFFFILVGINLVFDFHWKNRGQKSITINRLMVIGLGLVVSYLLGAVTYATSMPSELFGKIPLYVVEHLVMTAGFFFGFLLYIGWLEFPKRSHDKKINTVSIA